MTLKIVTQQKKSTKQTWLFEKINKISEPNQAKKKRGHKLLISELKQETSVQIP